MKNRRPEILDSVSLPPKEARRALDDLGRVNRLTLGFRATRRALLPRLGTESEHRIVDLGTGSGELLAVLERASRAKGIRLRSIGVDRKLDHLAHGRSRGFIASAVVADVAALPFRDNGFDWTLSTLLLHHFDYETAEPVVDEMVRVARRGALVTDLRAGLLTRIASRYLLPLFRIGRIAASDGRASADQAWGRDEVRRLARRHRTVELENRFPRRFSLILSDGGSPE